MKPIRVEVITSKGLKIDNILDLDWLKEVLAERPLGFSLQGPLKVSGEVRKTGQALLFQGKVSGLIGLTCGRCLETFINPVDESVTAEWRLLSPPSGKSGPEGAGQQLEDLETGAIREGDLDISERILEEIILNLPMQPLCRAACQGLCSICGANKNISPCTCRADGPSQPFSALKEFKIKKR
jgi:uncharacterized protein